jgi:hypothetical protein
MVEFLLLDVPAPRLASLAVPFCGFAGRGIQRYFAKNNKSCPASSFGLSKFAPHPCVNVRQMEGEIPPQAIVTLIFLCRRSDPMGHVGYRRSADNELSKRRRPCTRQLDLPLFNLATLRGWPKFLDLEIEAVRDKIRKPGDPDAISTAYGVPRTSERPLVTGNVSLTSHTCGRESRTASRKSNSYFSTTRRKRWSITVA